MSDVAKSVDWRGWMRDFGRRQRRVREFLALSHEEVAREAGVSEDTVIRLETARAVATPLLVAVKVGLTLASKIRRLDPATVPADLSRGFEMPNALPAALASQPDSETGRERDVEAMIAIYRGISPTRRETFLSIVSAAGDLLRTRPRPAGAARRAR